MFVGNNKISALWIGVSQVVLLVVGFALLKLLTINLSVEEFGYYSLCMSIVLFVRQMIYDPISITVSKEVGASVHEFAKVSTGFLIIKFITDRFGVVIFLVCFMFCLLAYALIGHSNEGLIVWICTFYLLANGAQGIYINLFNSIGDRKTAALYSMADSALKILFVCVVLFVFGAKLVYVLASISLSAAMIFLISRLYINKRFVGDAISSGHLKSLAIQSLIKSAPLYLPTLFLAFKSVGDRWVLATFTGVNELAAYSVLQQLGYSPVILIFGMVQTFFAPKIYRLSASDEASNLQELKQLLNRIFFSTLIFTLICTGLSMFTSEWILKLFTGRDYHNLSGYLPYFIVSGAVAAMSGILQVVAIGVFDVKKTGRIMSLSLLFSMAISSILTMVWGFIGSIAGLFFSSFFSSLMYWLAIKNNFSNKASLQQHGILYDVCKK
ncbi:MAG: hypothetical protein RL571_3025 [Pseudomonadota bacterium]